PRDAVKAGDIVKVKVMEVDLPRQRIGLSMRLDDEPGQARGRPAGAGTCPGQQRLRRCAVTRDQALNCRGRPACRSDALQHAVPYGMPYRNVQLTRPSRPGSIRMLRTRHLLGAIAAALLFSTAASATDFSKVVVFGDSLSDAGNLSLAQGSPTPLRFTTNPGKTAAELVAAGLGSPIQASLLGGTDYAFGGAGVVQGVAPVPTLPQQFQMYLAANGGHADSNALYQVWGGANDIFYLTGTTTDPNALAAGTVKAATTELGLLGQLQASGAKYVVVYNLPN